MLRRARQAIKKMLPDDVIRDAEHFIARRRT
jgi:hypothetical protein